MRSLAIGALLAGSFAAVGWAGIIALNDLAVNRAADTPFRLLALALVFVGPPVVGALCGLKLGWSGLAGALLGQVAGVFSGAALGDPIALAIDPGADVSSSAHGFYGLALFAGGLLLGPLTMLGGALAGWLVRRLSSSRERQP